MTRTDAEIAAAKKLEEIQNSCPVEIAFNHEVTEEHPIGWVFFYNSIDYWRTRDFQYALAGNCPILIQRATGDVILLPSNQSVRRSLKELESHPL